MSTHNICFDREKNCLPSDFLGVRPASCTHNFARGRKKLASVSPVDS